MIRRSWRTHLKATTSQQAVLSLVSQYLDEWTPAETSALPRGAWPSALRTQADVLAHALKLATIHTGFSGDSTALPGLQELLLFFTHAAVRSNQLTTAADAEKPPFSRVSGQKKPATSDDE